MLDDQVKSISHNNNDKQHLDLSQGVMHEYTFSRYIATNFQDKVLRVCSKTASDFTIYYGANSWIWCEMMWSPQGNLSEEAANSWDTTALTLLKSPSETWYTTICSELKRKRHAAHVRNRKKTSPGTKVWRSIHAMVFTPCLHHQTNMLPHSWLRSFLRLLV